MEPRTVCHSICGIDCACVQRHEVNIPHSNSNSNSGTESLSEDGPVNLMASISNINAFVIYLLLVFLSSLVYFDFRLLGSALVHSLKRTSRLLNHSVMEVSQHWSDTDARVREVDGVMSSWT